MRSSARVLRSLAFVGLLALAAGAAPPEVTRVRVPSEQLPKIFPAGTDYRVMPADRFEQLVRDAGRADADDAPRPRLLKADHSARWEGGTLAGRSEFVVGAEARAGELSLGPWTPAVRRATEGDARLVTDDAGRTRLRVAAGAADRNATVVVDWELNARPGADGRRFTLGLPEAGGGILTLDLPARFGPEGLGGVRQGPAPTEDPDRRRWTFSGARGGADLVLVDPADGGDGAGDARIWFEEKTAVAVGESNASWTLDAVVHAGPLAPRVLELELSAGLEPLGVSGGVVEGFRSGPGPDGTRRLAIRLARGGPSAGARVVVRGLAQVPLEGQWAVPAARPLNAVWTGGVTTVRVEPPRVVASVRPGNGVRVSEPLDDAALAFAAERPGPVAELVFARPPVELSAEVRGEVFLGNAAPRFVASLTYRAHRGRPHELDLDVPRAWAADKVTIEGVDEPLAWHTDPLPGGGTRLRVRSPSGDWSQRSLVLTVAATSTAGGGRGPLALPRVRPFGARVGDELWLARVEPGISLVPTVARGIAWVDPSTTSEFSAREADPARPALAWRWTADDAEARVDRTRVRARPVASLETVATLGADRLALEARARVLAHDAPLRRVVVGLSEPVDDPSAWRAFDDAGGAELPLVPLPAGERAANPGLGRGPAWSVTPSRRAPGPVEFVLRREGPWAGRGRVPLALLGDPPAATGRLRVVTRGGLRASLTTEHLTRLEPAAATNAPGADDEPTSQAFAYSGPDAVAEVRTDELETLPGPGLVRSAALSTRLSTEGPLRHRLSLTFVPGRAATLDVTLPPGSTPEAVRRGGRPVRPTADGPKLSIPVGRPESGPSAVVVEIDYQSPPPKPGALLDVRPALPGFSAPCLVTAWELSAPEPWRVADWAPALTPSDPSTRPKTGIGRLAAGVWPRLARARPTRSTANPEALLRGAEARSAGRASAPNDLGGWASVWDSGATPLLVDRPALDDRGVGPGARLARPKDQADGSDWRAGALARLGLRVVAVGRTLLLTTRSEAESERAASAGWADATAEAAAWGVDAGGRFCSVDRWRGEPFARAAAGRPSPSPDEAGRSVARFVTPGVPAPGASVRLVDGRRQSAGGWASALAVLAAALSLRGSRPTVRASASTLALALGLLAVATAPPALLGPALGLVAGAAGAAALLLGDSLGRRAGSAPRAPSPPSTLRRVARVGSTPIAVLGTVGLTASWSPAQVPAVLDPTPILAVYPYDGAPDPSRPPDRVVLKLADFQRLQRLADERRNGPGPGLRATDVLHRLRWRDDGWLTFESTWTLLGEGGGGGQARWGVPVDGGRDFSATLDGEGVPVRIEPGGKSASVVVPLSGVTPPSRTLVVRRTVEPRRGDDGPALALSVTPAANARLEVGADGDGVAPEVSTARGRVERVAGGGLTARVGPVDHLDVRWRPGAGRNDGPSGDVDMLLLWDALPSGDRLRARLTYRDPAGTSVARVALGPGLLVRGSDLPASGDAAIETADGRPEWVGRFDPPLPDGSTIALDLWRPRAEDLAEGVARRSMPEVAPLRVERASGTVALRRPSAWLGRIAPGPDNDNNAPAAEVVAEEGFVRAWGPLPDDALTLSGAARFETSPTRSPAPEVAVGPAPARFLVRNEATATIAPGRVDVVVDATLTTPPPLTPHDEAEAVLPPGFRVVQVSGDGLGFWGDSGGEAAPRSIRLRFDGAPRPVRRVRVVGWLPVKFDPLDAAALGREAAVPWPDWPGQNVAPGRLVVSGPVRAELVDSPGASEEAPETPGPGRPSSTASAFRAAYRVGRPSALGRLRWKAEPAGASVHLQNQLTVRPETVDWLAVVRYEVSGGLLDAINLKVSGDWAKDATVELDGVGHQRVTEVQEGVTYWLIRPDRPVWGTQRLVVRSSRPFRPGETLAYPELLPLGRKGGVDCYLRVVQETRQPLSVENPTGVLLVESPVPGLEDELSVARRSGEPATTYHVVRPGWSLSLAKPVQAPEETTRDDVGELTLVAAADGSALGFGRYQVGPQEGGTLTVTLPDGSEPVEVSVDGRPAPLRRVGPGRLEIPVAESRPARLTLVWRKAPASPGSNAGVALPVVGRGRAAVSVVVRAPEGASVRDPDGGLAATSADWLGLNASARAERDALDLLARHDGRSRRDADRLVGLIARARRGLDGAARAAANNPGLDDGRREPRATLVRAATSAFETRLVRALKGAALGDDAAAARAALAGPSADPGPVAADGGPAEPAAMPGRHHAFVGTIEAGGPAPRLLVSAAPGARPSDRSAVLGLAAFAALGPPSAWQLARRARGSAAFAAVALVGLGAVAALASGPLALALVAGLAAVGAAARARSAEAPAA